VSNRFPIKGGVWDWSWVTDNPHPPHTDPKVVADPHGIWYHDPRSTLPIAEIRPAVEEFCRAGTAERPESVPWAKAYSTGERRTE
jgi:hypothetical protein